MRRAANSIIANIAEGSRQFSKKAYIRFLRMSFGSASELESHIQLATALGFMPVEKQQQIMYFLDQELRMLNKLSNITFKAQG